MVQAVPQSATTEDYGGPTPVVVSFSSTEKEKEVTFTIDDDFIKERSEQFQVAIDFETTPVSTDERLCSPAKVTVTIADNDSLGKGKCMVSANDWYRYNSTEGPA